MTGRIVVSPRARGDLEDIWDYTVERWGLDQAEFYFRQLWQHIDAVAMRRLSGDPVPKSARATTNTSPAPTFCSTAWSVATSMLSAFFIKGWSTGSTFRVKVAVKSRGSR
ncbi:MAG: type II toxin-antitoxin system RelE/ParE family toxin [Rhodospirillales bacterium]